MQLSFDLLMILATCTVAHALPGSSPATRNVLAEPDVCPGAPPGCFCYCFYGINLDNFDTECKIPGISNGGDCDSIKNAHLDHPDNSLSIPGRGQVYEYTYKSCVVKFTQVIDFQCTAYCPEFFGKVIDHLSQKCNGLSAHSKYRLDKNDNYIQFRVDMT